MHIYSCITTCIMNTVMHLSHFYCHHHFHNHCCQFIYCHYLFITCMLGVLCLAISRLHHIYTTFTPNLHQIYMAYTPSHTALYTAPGSASTPPPHRHHTTYTTRTPPSHHLRIVFTLPPDHPPSSLLLPSSTATTLLSLRPYPASHASTSPLHCHPTFSTPPHTASTLPPQRFFTTSTQPPQCLPQHIHTASTPLPHRTHIVSLSLSPQFSSFPRQPSHCTYVCCLHIMLTPSSLAPTHCFHTTISLHSHFIHPHCIHTTLLLFLHHAFTAFTPHSHSIHQQTQKFHQQLPC